MKTSNSNMRLWHVAAAIVATVGLPGIAAAQGSAALYSQSWDTCTAQVTDYAGAVGTAQTRPVITDERSLVPIGQYVWARWTLYRQDDLIPSKGLVPLQTSNWWRGVATPSDNPGQWFEFATDLLHGGLVATGKSALVNPSWGISKALGPYGTTFYALMEFQWQPLSNTGTAWPSKKVWASGYCYWPFPR